MSNKKIETSSHRSPDKVLFILVEPSLLSLTMYKSMNVYWPWRRMKFLCSVFPCDVNDSKHSQLAFYVNLHRAVIGPSATLTGRWRPDIDLRRMLTGFVLIRQCLKHCDRIQYKQNMEDTFSELACFYGSLIILSNRASPSFFSLRSFHLAQ